MKRGALIILFAALVLDMRVLSAGMIIGPLPGGWYLYQGTLLGGGGYPGQAYITQDVYPGAPVFYDSDGVASYLDGLTVTALPTPDGYVYVLQAINSSNMVTGWLCDSDFDCQAQCWGCMAPWASHSFLRPGRSGIADSGLAAFSGYIGLNGQHPAIGTEYIPDIIDYPTVPLSLLDPELLIITGFNDGAVWLTDTNTGRDFTLTKAFLPEPSAWLMVAVGVSLGFWTVRRKRAS